MHHWSSAKKGEEVCYHQNDLAMVGNTRKQTSDLGILRKNNDRKTIDF